MEKQKIQLLNESILPVNETTITLGEKMLVTDTLASPLTLPEAHGAWGRFPMKLSMSSLLIVESGEVRLNVNCQDVIVGGGCCAFISESAIVERVAMGNARVVLISFYRDHFHAMPSIQQNALQVEDWKMGVGHMTMLIQAYHMLRTILLDNAFAPNREESAASCLNLMASIIGQVDDSQSTDKASRSDKIVARFLQCVRENYREHRELGFYANELQLTPKYMSHVVFEQTGRHPSKWIKDYVILEAKSMLRSGRYTIQQIAEELHFPNQSFFGKYFKEAVGVSPKKWK
ncbi:MAG: helix-turn-helix transcriptional regulator [Muribaculaceae bacterium]|nr:helix-turn-helix transcriptional regulator [Muribaculaceae bacterium]